MGNGDESVFGKACNVEDDFKSYLDSGWSYDEVRQMSTTEIIEKLGEFGIAFDKKDFLRDVETFYSGSDIAEKWFKTFRVTAKRL